ncbi:sulfurtransferase [Luteimonas kalidii]|uniref:Sulfurtransferase n=1 Tax=Luteimonas kalidii TaxID=3042025 RepID=A0ABT6JPB7_9GAMM|nr:sulfurtransferase [Luteimonas kalidii]MDH5832487.1 sulfurtransferase [Luteimonas kalidii]
MIRNIAAYRFVEVDDPPALAADLRTWAEAGALRGTVLVAPEGINLFLAGADDAIEGFLDRLRADPRFAAIGVKHSWSQAVPFARLKVKLKREIISFRRDGASPLRAGRAPAVAPAVLARWLRQGRDDDGRPVVTLDTRNREETGYGTFAGALTLPIDNFTDLPAALAPHRAALADATVVSYCTGGIRCEKAAPWMRASGIDRVFQLEGGILGYFEAVGGEGFEGRCFVFDDRVALDPDLRPLAGGAHPAPVHAGVQAA